MKFSAAAVSLALAASANAHTIFQQISVNGANQGLGKGIRIPSSNYPVEDVNSANLACNANIGTAADKISIAAGAKVGTQWGHVLGGAQFNPDPDNPIAASHKGPIQVYLAKVSNAVSSGTSGLAWFKVHSEGFVNGKSAVDVMIANAGWYYFNMPTCVAPGDYLMRVELLALHNAYNYPGAQFYQSCAQITITGSGTLTNPPTVSLPGAYSGTNPGIKVNIYPPPANYVAPGPAVISCNGAPAPAPSSPAPAPAPVTTTRAAAPSPTPSTAAPVGGTVAKYGQCGGIGYTGPKTCAAGSTCKANGDYYSQCV